MPVPIRLALVGLSDAERRLVAEVVALLPGVDLVLDIDRAQRLVADAEHTPSVKLVLAAEMLKRTLWVGTPPPMGSVAVVDRPLDPLALQAALTALLPRHAPAPAPPLPPAPAEPPPPQRALLVDDSEIALRFLETRLQRWSLLMDRALSSQRAVELLATGERYDFVFIDVELGPQSSLDGFALAQHIRRQHQEDPGPVLVMVSAHTSPSHRVRGQLAGCDAYLAKPLDEVELQRLLLRHGLKPRAAPRSAAG
ncbi:MAG: response regulator [Betaproteobacteria bacterium]|jgi:two-component system cell cycle response regulator